MAGQPGFFDADERLKAVSVAGDPLERLSKVVDIEVFRENLEAALARVDRTKGPVRRGADALEHFHIEC
jgi:hypothetical protein